MKSEPSPAPSPRRGRFGPGLLVAAAFIGPGTVTTASVAGASFGYALLWALVFSVIATIVLQEMAARVGLVSGRGLGQALRDSLSGSWLAGPAIALVVAAVGFGNAAYQAGNLTGAALGLQGLGSWDSRLWIVLVGILAALLLASGRYQLIEKALVVLVLAMSAVFITTFLMLSPDLGDMLRAAVTPTLPAGATLTVLALIGTTVVPYNLFLHASAVHAKWGDAADTDAALRAARQDTGLSVMVGGAVTLAVMGTAAAAFYGTGAAVSAASMAQQLEPLLGPAARYCFAVGLFAAGLSSAVTAPLAAAYAVCGVLGWGTQLRSRRFRAVWMAVLASGLLFALLGTSPIAAILFAQAANGLLLPVCAIFLLWVMNRSPALGRYRNGWPSNLAGAVVVLVTLGLGLVKILGVLRVL
ncbi:Nramp family divalent metal transporter [Haliea sp. E17]|uniref:Nramp family divalent metal transporter n=1 Tax=Haliea sp. E17 TaxID=3401576 RepID=UPI003AB0F836